MAAHFFTMTGYIFKTRAQEPAEASDGVFRMISMNFRHALLASIPTLLATALLVLGGCRAHIQPAVGRIVSTEGDSVPVGSQPARIVEIDGDRVFPSQRSFALAPGTHIIRVSPPIAGPTHQVPTEFGVLAYLSDEPLELDVEAGWTYFIGLEVIEPIDYTKRSGHWRAIVVRSARSDREPS